MHLTANSFPHPVFGVPGAFVGPSPVVDVVPHIPLKERIADPYEWTFTIQLNNPELESLIAAGRAQFMCEIKCSATFFRQCVTTEKTAFSVTLLRRWVNRRIEFSLWVVATERIPDYRNSAADPDYRALEPFDIEKGAPLAFLKAFHWDADLCYEDLTSLRSILQILPNTENPEEEMVVIDTDYDYVRVYLPNAQYEEFVKVSARPEIANVMHSSLILFVLQTALIHYGENGENKHRWERALDLIFQKDERFVGLDLAKKEDAAEIAQKLLNNPIRRLGDSLVGLVRDDEARGEEVEDEQGE